jgi:hypothetical protein
MRAGELTIRVQVHRQSLTKVKELHEQFRARAVAVSVIGTKPGNRIRCNSFSEHLAIWQHR